MNPAKLYIGLSQNVKERLKGHNEGDTQYTKTYRPWDLEGYIAFTNKSVAQKFERYLKSGSGFAFLKKHFLMGNQLDGGFSGEGAAATAAGG